MPTLLVTYSWWEDEAKPVLWAFNVPDICGVIRYGLFRDENVARDSLLRRNADNVNAFLVELSDAREHQLLGKLCQMQRAEILRRSRILPFEEVPWTWYPPQPGHALNASEIAGAIEAESHRQFCRLAFEEIVRASLGYFAGSVKWLLQQHTVLYTQLRNHHHIYPGEIPLYIEAEKVSQNPFRTPESVIQNIRKRFFVHKVPLPIELF